MLKTDFELKSKTEVAQDILKTIIDKLDLRKNPILEEIQEKEILIRLLKDYILDDDSLLNPKENIEKYLNAGGNFFLTTFKPASYFIQQFINDEVLKLKQLSR